MAHHKLTNSTIGMVVFIVSVSFVGRCYSEILFFDDFEQETDVPIEVGGVSIQHDFLNWQQSGIPIAMRQATDNIVARPFGLNEIVGANLRMRTKDRFDFSVGEYVLSFDALPMDDARIGSWIDLGLDNTSINGSAFVRKIDGFDHIEWPFSVTHPRKAQLWFANAVWLDNVMLERLDFVLGDANQDNLLTNQDLRDLSDAIRAGAAPEAHLDLNGDGTLDLADRMFWIEELHNSMIGDSNLDGQFDSGDLVKVMIAGTYENPAAAGRSDWFNGDWSGDATFNSTDLVLAMQAGWYNAGPRAVVEASPLVPEPSSFILFTLGIVLFSIRHRCREGRGIENS